VHSALPIVLLHDRFANMTDVRIPQFASIFFCTGYDVDCLESSRPLWQISLSLSLSLSLFLSLSIIWNVLKMSRDPDEMRHIWPDLLKFYATSRDLLLIGSSQSRPGIVVWNHIVSSSTAATRTPVSRCPGLTFTNSLQEHPLFLWQLLLGNSLSKIYAVCFTVVKVVSWSRGGGSPDEARLEQTPYPFQPH